MTKKTPLRDKRKVEEKVAKLLGEKPIEGKKEPVADKKGFFNLLNRAARSSVKPSVRTSGKKISGD